jgi:hypothetical protein
VTLQSSREPATPTLSPPARDTHLRLTGVLALATATAGLAYAVIFVVLGDPVLAPAFLLLGGLLAIPVLLAVSSRLRGHTGEAVNTAVVLALLGSVGAAVHGGYDLANALNPPTVSTGDLPNPVDPRGLLTFGVAGLGLLILGWLMSSDHGFPRRLGRLACLTGATMMLLYLGRLTVLDPAHPLVLVPALLTGFILTPLLYTGLGLTLLRTASTRA